MARKNMRGFGWVVVEERWACPPPVEKELAAIAHSVRSSRETAWEGSLGELTQQSVRARKEGSEVDGLMDWAAPD
jgi:hypothetical protein